MKIENIDIKDITPYAKNAKKHTKKQIKQIEQSIEDFGFNDPIAIDEKRSGYRRSWKTYGGEKPRI